ncbi:hypothetical protein I3843_01G194300 [Carya illinoinensis]|uniref:Thiol methyltransferase 2 n=1 Tax=Carya illinoinensis TaxID=32201 RepID=A0A922G5S0_CARIL|nr:hypothetical protein I3842_01G201600 [Carya illinoinensis]KAG7997097.1 hypothetical protein I3843_01G194300 [Carya illinoinensis]
MGHTLFQIRSLQSIITRAISSRNLGIIASKQVRMEKRDESHGNNGVEATTRSINPRVDKLQQFVRSDSTGGWQDSWEQGVTPWDLGRPTPVILHLHQTGALPKGRALVPGCGSGYDVVAIACPERHVVGLDISNRAIMKAEEISDQVGGPPYKVSVSDYEEVLHPMGFKAISIVDNELAIRPRQGREKLGRWKRSSAQSSL